MASSEIEKLARQIAERVCDKRQKLFLWSQLFPSQQDMIAEVATEMASALLKAAEEWCEKTHTNVGKSLVSGEPVGFTQQGANMFASQLRDYLRSLFAKPAAQEEHD